MVEQLKYLASLFALLCLSACATTTAFKPEGLSEKQAEYRLNDLRFACRTVRVGEPVNVSFYPGGKDASAAAVQEGLKGYFYAFNRMTDTVYISEKPLTLFDRGTPYDLQYVQNIVPTTATPKKMIPVVMIPREVDLQLALLAQ